MIYIVVYFTASGDERYYRSADLSDALMWSRISKTRGRPILGVYECSPVDDSDADNDVQVLFARLMDGPKGRSELLRGLAWKSARLDRAMGVLIAGNVAKKVVVKGKTKPKTMYQLEES